MSQPENVANVEQLMYSLRVERSLERVRAGVFRMEKSSDIAGVAQLIWEELRRLGYDVPRCGLSILDEEHNFYGGYHVFDLSRLPLKSGWLEGQQDAKTTVNEGPLRPGGPYREELIAAWRSGTVFRLALTDAVKKKALADFVRRWSALPFGVEEMPDTYYLYVPFEFGVIGVSSLNLDPGQFSTEDEGLFRRFGEAFADGYRRFLEMREREIQQAVDHLQARVTSMRQSSDIVDVIVDLAEQLLSLGLEWDACSISVIDDEARLVRIYSVTPARFAPNLKKVIEPIDRSKLGKLREFDRPVFVESIAGDLDFSYVVEPLENSLLKGDAGEPPRILRRTPEDVEAVRPVFQRRYQVETCPVEIVPRAVIHVPFSQGRIAVSSVTEGAFTLRDVDLVAAFADPLTLGFTRLHDFQQLEQRNLQLEVEHAVQHLRAEVASMRKSADIVEVITELAERLAALGIDFHYCSIGIIEENTTCVRIYTVIRSDLGAFHEARPEDQYSPRSVVNHLWELNEPVFVKNITEKYDFGYTVEPLEESPIARHEARTARIVHRSRREAEDLVGLYRRRWDWGTFSSDLVGRSLILVPFSHGRIGVVSMKPDLYNQKDVDLVAAFADAVSLGFTRFLDFRHLEHRNRELEIERSVEKVQLAVQAMESSADIVRVIPLIAQEIWHLGLDFQSCSIRLFDSRTEKVRVYLSARTESPFWADVGRDELPFSKEAIDVLEKQDQPIGISGIPGAEDQIVIHMNAPFDSYYGERQTEKTVVISRTDEELNRVIPAYEKYWKTKPWPDIWYVRSVIRTTFDGGTIALMDARPNHFTSSETQILERYAEAFGLGYARHLDFRRLEEQNRALEAASRLKSDFLANMSHEIRTPMNAVINFSALILDGTYGEISDDLRDAVEEIDRNGEALLSLINDLLDLSKISAGAMRLHCAECSPEECIDTAIASLEYKAREKGLEVIREVDGSLGVMVADQRRITQHVLQNLLRNAIKFTPQGEIRVGARRDANDILFWVADTGIGIPKNEQETVFESFRQVDGSLTREAEGTGLGLTIARKFVEMHGGEIRLESEVGRGSRFEFTIPFAN